MGGLITKLDVQCGIEIQTVCDVKNDKMKLIKLVTMVVGLELSPGRL